MSNPTYFIEVWIGSSSTAVNSQPLPMRVFYEMITFRPMEIRTVAIWKITPKEVNN